MWQDRAFAKCDAFQVKVEFKEPARNFSSNGRGFFNL